MVAYRKRKGARGEPGSSPRGEVFQIFSADYPEAYPTYSACIGDAELLEEYGIPQPSVLHHFSKWNNFHKGGRIGGVPEITFSIWSFFKAPYDPLLKLRCDIGNDIAVK